MQRTIGRDRFRIRPWIRCCRTLKLGLLVYLLGYTLAATAAAAPPLAEGMKALQQGDYAEAFCLLQPLAKQGNAAAQYNIGWLYANGNGLRVNMEKAAWWWKRAAAQGYRDAEFALGLAYTTGEGIGRDEAQAVEWYLRAARHGHEEAREILRGMLTNGVSAATERLATLVNEPWLGTSLQVKVDKANVRAGKGTDTPIITTLPTGTRVIEIDRQGKWRRVVLKDPVGIGWIYDTLVD